MNVEKWTEVLSIVEDLGGKAKIIPTFVAGEGAVVKCGMEIEGVKALVTSDHPESLDAAFDECVEKMWRFLDRVTGGDGEASDPKPKKKKSPPAGGLGGGKPPEKEKAPLNGADEPIGNLVS